MRDIEKYVNSSCDTLCISMDYGTEGRRIRSGDNELIKERIRQIVKAGKKVYIIFNLHAMNIDKLDEMTAFAKEIGSKYNFSLFTAPVDDINQTYQITLSEKCLDKLIKRDRNEGNGYIEDAPDTDCIGCRKSCGAGKNLIAVASDGKLYPCHMFLNSKYILGNALTENIGEILDKADFQNIISVEHKPECSDCEYKYVCGGGCPFRGLSVGGSIECKDSMCTAYQQLYNETMIKLLA
jgi:radical SAM protein with 4Fe4S-binding SPASM domain